MNLAIIPARGGSKRIPKKNIKNFCKKPIIAYSIETALASKLFDRVIVSTDDEEIAKVALSFGAEVPFLRPKELSDDFTGLEAIIEHALDALKLQNEYYEFVCMIFATAPFLKKEYLQKGYEMIKQKDAWQALGVTTFTYPIQRAFMITKEKRCKMFYSEFFSSRSQDLEQAYHDAAQFYWYNFNKKPKDIPFGSDTIPVEIPRYLVQDIDTEEDWIQAELMYTAYKNNTKK